MYSPFLRTTIAVANERRLEESIRFYKEVLDLELKLDLVIDDQQFPSALLGFPKVKVRIVALGRPEATHGWIGLLQYLEPADIEVPALEDKKPNQPYPVAFVLRTTDIQGHYDRVRAFGAKVISPPVRVNYPGKAPGWCMTCLDPNGALIDISGFDDKLL